MKALIVGLGSIGRRHVKNLKTIDPKVRIAVWRHSERGSLGELCGLVEKVFYSLETALAWRPDLAVIANPAPLHVPTALSLAQNEVHLFIEKPLADSLEGLDSLLELCRNRALTLMVGYNLRFERSLQAVRQVISDGKIGRVLAVHAEVGQFLPDWRPDCDYRQSVSARKALGGGAVLELSHEMDYLRWLIGDVRCVSARLVRLSDLEIDVEDTAEIVLEFGNGVLGSVHLDMIQRSPVRTCRLVGTEGTLVWDGLARRSLLFTLSNPCWTALSSEGDQDRNESYLEEMRHFIESVETRRSPRVSGEDGRRVLEIALAVRRSSDSGQVVKL